MTEALYDFLDPRTRANPFPLYKHLRETEPVCWIEGLQGWLLTRYADCEDALREPSLSLGGGLAAIFAGLAPEIEREVQPLKRHILMGMGSLDPPEHTRIRSPMNRAFTARLIREQSDFIQKLTDEMLDEWIDRGAMEVVGDIAYPLPAIVIANLLGTTRANQHLFLKCSDAIGELFGSASPSLEVVRAAQENVLALSAHLHEIVERRRHEPAPDDLVGTLLATEGEEQGLIRDELIANCVELLFAGHLTITSMIGTAVMTVLKHPQALEQLRANPRFMPSAVEEIVRFDGPIQMVRRMATRPVTLGGQRIAEGQMVWAHLGAANRDPRRYSDPDSFDIHRENMRQLGFGVGVHYCLGAALARLECEIVLTTMLRRLPRMRLATEELEWHDLPTVRTLKALPIEF